MSALGKFLPLASGEADYDDGDWSEQAHEHLAGQCPWYAKVAGGGSPGGEECKLTALVLTPHTAEASTVPQPTVPPGGPGLFHIKGRELPPYVQHLYKHLVGRYGKHRAYGVAVGIVKKWAAGVHPGGKHGKGKHKGGGHVHADVQAAAAKNMAQWEKDKADAHRLHGKDGKDSKHSGHKVAATSPAGSPLELARPYTRVERGKLERVSGYNRHGTVAFDFDGVLGASRHYGWPLPVKPDFSGVAKAHKRGYNAAVVTANDPPLVARELRRQGFTTALDPAGQTLFWQGGPDGKTVLVTTRKVSAKAYIDDRAVNHMWGDDWEHTLDNVDRVREGYHPVEQPGDHHHFTELSAPPDNVVRVYLAAPASWPSGKPYRESFLPPGPTTGGGLLQGSPLRPGAVSNAPGTKPVGLRQQPSAAVSASPPLPPGVTLPDPSEFEKIARKVPGGADETLAESARKHLRMAAVKLRKGDHTEALRALRSAQTGLHAAYRAAYNENLPNTTQVYGAITKVPPAQQSSATTEMLAGREVTEQYRTLHHEVAKHIDTFRRAHFHGQYQHMPEARFSGVAEDVRTLALAFWSRSKDSGSGAEQVRGYERVEHGHLEHVGPSERERKALEWWQARAPGVAHSTHVMDWPKTVNNASQDSQGAGVYDRKAGMLGTVEKRGHLWHAQHLDGSELGGKATKGIAVKTVIDYHNQMASRPRADPERVRELETEQLGIGHGYGELYDHGSEAFFDTPLDEAKDYLADAAARFRKAGFSAERTEETLRNLLGKGWSVAEREQIIGPALEADRREREARTPRYLRGMQRANSPGTPGYTEASEELDRRGLPGFHSPEWARRFRVLSAEALVGSPAYQVPARQELQHMMDDAGPVKTDQLAMFTGSGVELAGSVVGLLDRFALRHPVLKDGAPVAEAAARPARRLPSPGKAPADTGELPPHLTRRIASGRVRPYFREEHGREVGVHGYDRLAENIEGTARQMSVTRAAQHLYRASEYLRAGDHDAAINHLVSAHTIAGGHPDVWEHLQAVRAASTQGPLARALARGEQPRQGRQAGHEQRDFHAAQGQAGLERVLRQAGPNPHGAAGAVFK